MQTLLDLPSPRSIMTREDFSVLIRENHGALMAYARMITGDAVKAGDIVQDSFVVAWQNIGKFDVTRDVACWLRGIVRNKWREACRRARREISMDEETLAAVEQTVTAWEADRPEIFDRLARCRERLPLPFAECITACYYEKLSTDDAAVRLGINCATFRKRLERARAVLRLCLQQNLEAGGSTNGGSGIKRAYKIAKENFIKDGVNRVILATDGDFNVGITDTNQLVELVKERAADNIYLSVLGFGTGNLNDSLMESISKDGNGNHYYIDSIREGRKVFLQRLSGTLITIAKDVKIQIEFNPRKVGSYRLIGYANRVLRNEDFNNDKVDAGDIGAGHTVTAFYEIVPAELAQPNAGGIDALKYQKPTEKVQDIAPAAEPSDEWLTLKLRHKSPEGDISSLQESVVKGPAIRWQESDGDFSFASAVALFGMKLRGMDEAKHFNWTQIRGLAAPGLKDDRNESRAEFIGLLEILGNREG